MFRTTASFSLIASASGAKLSPSTPGNWNLPTPAGFGADLLHSLPEINVNYHYPASFLQGQSDIDSALSQVSVTDVPDDSGMDQFMLGLAHSPRPTRSSFLSGTDPMELLPPGVTQGLASSISDEQPYTFVLHPPVEATAATNQLIDSFAKQESGAERQIEDDAIAAKQQLLRDELGKIHALVAQHRRGSFLNSIYGGSVRKADYELVLHAPSESAADINAEANEVLKIESNKARSAGQHDAALKQALLQAEIAKIGRIVRGGSSFLEPFVPPIAVQTAQQASLPNVISINYDVPKSSFVEMPKADLYFENNASAQALEREYENSKKSSFLGAHGDSTPRAMPVLNIDIPVRA